MATKSFRGFARRSFGSRTAERVAMACARSPCSTEAAAAAAAAMAGRPWQMTSSLRVAVSTSVLVNLTLTCGSLWHCLCCWLQLSLSVLRTFPRLCRASSASRSGLDRTLYECLHPSPSREIHPTLIVDLIGSSGSSCRVSKLEWRLDSFDRYQR